MVRLFKHYIPHAVLLLGVLEFLLLLLAAELAWGFRTWQIGIGAGPLADRRIELFLFTGTVQLSLVAVGGYGIETLRSMRIATARILVAMVVAVMLISVLAFLVPGDIFWRSVLLYAVALSVLLLMVFRAVAGPILGTARFVRRIVVLGAGGRARRLLELSERPHAGVSVISFIAMGGAGENMPGAIARGDIVDLGKFVHKARATEVVLALEERRNALPLNDLVRVKTRGVKVTEFSTFLERETGRVDLDTLNPSWLIFSDGFASGQGIAAAAKRVFDIVSSLSLLIVTAPIVLLAAIAIKLESRGPALFRQTRVGLFNQRFELVKLRSMCLDAERDGSQWASENDPRITRVGRIIRKVRIDELPQLWMVLQGRMSFVGPRPEVPRFVEQLQAELPYYAERHMVKPGITGWAQINFPYGASTEDARHKLEYDLYYAKNYSLFLDLIILLQTLRVIIWSGGAR